MMTLDSFKSARSVLSGVINETNLIYSPAFSASCGNNVYLKPENMQVTGAYKIRGAYFKISTLLGGEGPRPRSPPQATTPRAWPMLPVMQASAPRWSCPPPPPC